MGLGGQREAIDAVLEDGVDVPIGAGVAGDGARTGRVATPGASPTK